MVASSPIKDIEEINLIKDLYKRKNRIRDLLMFTLAINTGLSLTDILNLRVKDVKGKLYLPCERKKLLPLNEELQGLIVKATEGLRSTDYLFRNQWGETIDRTGVFHCFKSTCQELGLSERYSVASWRKTFAYHYYRKYKDISYLMWLFNQHTAELALKFIDVEENMNLRFREGVCL